MSVWGVMTGLCHTNVKTVQVSCSEQKQPNRIHLEYTLDTSLILVTYQLIVAL